MDLSLLLQKAAARWVRSVLMIGLFFGIFGPRLEYNTDENVRLAFKNIVKVQPDANDIIRAGGSSIDQNPIRTV